MPKNSTSSRQPQAEHSQALTVPLAQKTPLEIPTWVHAVLPDGRILGMNEKWSALTIFDREGKVVSRCSVPGSMSLVRTEKDRICFAEWRGPDTHGFVYDELFDETTTHVWRLDPVEKKGD